MMTSSNERFIHIIFRFRERLWLSFKASLYFNPRRIIHSILLRCHAPSACEILSLLYTSFAKICKSVSVKHLENFFYGKKVFANKLSGGNELLNRIAQSIKFFFIFCHNIIWCRAVLVDVPVYIIQIPARSRQLFQRKIKK